MAISSTHPISVFVSMSVKPLSRGFVIFIMDKNFRSVECDAWKLEPPGAVRSRSEFAVSLRIPHHMQDTVSA